MKSIIEGLINGVPAHVSGKGVRIDVDDLRGILAKAYNAGEDSARQYQILTPQEVQERGAVIEGIVLSLYPRLAPVVAPSRDKLVAALQLAYDEGKRTLASDPRVAEHRLYLTVNNDETISFSCTNCTWSHSDDAILLEDVFPIFEAHLALVIDPLGDLPDGTYWDGTYEWVKDEEGWVALQAPQGMPSQPSREGLRRVQKSYVPV